MVHVEKSDIFRRYVLLNPVRSIYIYIYIYIYIQDVRVSFLDREGLDITKFTLNPFTRTFIHVCKVVTVYFNYVSPSSSGPQHQTPGESVKTVGMEMISRKIHF